MTTSLQTKHYVSEIVVLVGP